LTAHFRGFLGLAAKLAVAVVVIDWLVLNDRLTGGSFRPVLEHWGRLPLCFALLGCIPLIGALRWHMFLRGQGFEVSYRRALHLTLVGMLFNCVGIGYTGGDVAKAYFAAADQPKGRRAEAVTTVAVDRLSGLLGLLALGLLAVLLKPEAVWGDPRLRAAAAAMLVAVAVIALALLVGLVSRRAGGGWLSGRLERLPGGGTFLRVCRAILVYRRRPGIILAAVGLSVVAHAINIAFAWQIGRALAMPAVSAAEFAFAIATGLVISTFGPPLGIGFGQGAFDLMLRPLGVAIGAALATLMQAVNLVFYVLVGLPAFLLVRKESARVRAEMAEDALAAAAAEPAGKAADA
jgi:hypothetical protein